MKIFKDFRFYLLLILTVISILFVSKITIFGLTNSYYILIGLVLLTLILIVALLSYQKRKALRIMGIVLCLLLTASFGYGTSVVDNVYDAIKQFEENAKQKSKLQYSVIVNEKYEDESQIPTIQELKDKSFAVLEMGNISYNHEVVELIREDVGTKIQFESISSIEEALQKMNKGEIDCLVINESIRYLIDFDLAEYTTVIKSYEFETEKIVEANQAKVTKEPFIVYLTGIDCYGSLEYVSRSDVNKIVVVNPITKDLLIIDIPRDYYVPLTCYYDQLDKLTHSGNFGAACTVETVESFFDIDINYYARVNFTSVVSIIDALGGIDVYADYDFCEDIHENKYCFNKGLNHLDGAAALEFARERYSLPEGDQSRVKNQTLVLKGIINKVLSPSILKNYDNLLDIISKNVETNLPTEDIISLIQMQLKDNAEWNIESYTCVGEEAYSYSAMMGRDLYMRLPIESAVEETKALIDDFMHREY